MIKISKSLPINFWLNGQEVFSEKVETGIQQKKWNQKFNLSDNIRLQILDSVYKVYRVALIKHDGITDIGDINYVEIGTKNFSTSKTGDNYYYDIIFTMSELGAVDKQVVRLIIISEELPEPILELLILDGNFSGFIGTLASSVYIY